MAQNKNIGRVISVDNFSVLIKLDDDLHSSYKSGVEDVYEIARINSYIIIPVGADRIVCLITRVRMLEDAEIDKTMTIKLPTSTRYVTATMLGTIKKEEEEIFIQGVYKFPILDNPVWYVTEDDLNHIFDNNPSSKEILDYTKDFYLPIGTSPAFDDYQVKICPDLFFAKHAAILGNTGSGKSCTVTSIIRKLFKHDYKDNNNQSQKLQNAHFVIFDTNGEYKEAFIPDNLNEDLKQINAYYYGDYDKNGDGEVKVPYWFMNWEEFYRLLKPGEGVQAPILKKAIGLAKNESVSVENEMLPLILMININDLLSYSTDELKKRTGASSYGWKWTEENQVTKIGRAIKEFKGKLGKEIQEKLGEEIIKLGDKESFNNAQKQAPITTEIAKLFHQLREEYSKQHIENEENIDLPTWFSYKKLCREFIEKAIQYEESSNSRIREYTSTLLLRIHGFLNDKRIAIPLILKNDGKKNNEILAQFIAFILGDFNKHYAEENAENFIQKYSKKYNKKYNLKNTNTNQITIIDLSLLPFEILDIVTALLGRLIIEFVSHFIPDIRGQHPIVLILEEAQNYISEEKKPVAKDVFERIAREGRKYGVSLVVCSQRPSELSKTVLSQCNSFIIHRLQNPEDQRYIKSLVSSANADILNQLPIIPQRHAIIMGDCVRTPVQVRIDEVSPIPNSRNPEYINKWLNSNFEKSLYEDTCQRWLNQKPAEETPQTPTDENGDKTEHNPKPNEEAQQNNTQDPDSPEGFKDMDGDEPF